MVLTMGASGRYLYVQHSDKEVSVVDVTDPSRPVVLKNTFWLEGAKVGDVTFFGDYGVGQVLPSVCSRPVPQGRLPQHPSHPDAEVSLCGFNHLKRTIRYEGLLYILSDTGLWMVKPSA